jgi:MFS family permease
MFQLPAGWLVDRADRRGIMVASQVVRLLAAMVLIVALGLLGGPFWLLIVVVVVVGICSVFHDIAENATVRDILYGVDDTPRPRDTPEAAKRKSAMAGHEARVHIAQVAGRPLGGFLFGASHLLPYVIEALTVLFSLHMIRKIRTGRSERRGRRGRRRPRATTLHRPYFRRTLHEVASSRRLLAEDRFLSTVLTVCTVANFLFQVVVLLLIVSAERRDISTSLTGLFLSASGIGGMAGAFAAPRLLRKRRPQTIVMWCVWSWLILVLLVAVVNHPLVGLLAWGSCSYMGAHVNIALEVHKGDRIPRAHQGKITSLGRFLTNGAIPLGALSGGYLIAALDPAGTAALVAGVMFVLAFVVTAGVYADANRAPVVHEAFVNSVAEERHEPAERAALLLDGHVGHNGALAAKSVAQATPRR